MIRWNRTVWAVAVIGALAVARPAGAQQLPKGDDILDKYVTVTGGKEAYEKIKSRVAKGTIEVSAAGLKGTVTVYAAAPNKMLTVAELPGFGTVEDGTDGKVAWSTNPATGPAVKEGAAKEAALRRADFQREINWRKHYKKAETVGEQEVEGKPCYKVELTTTDGDKRTQYFDRRRTCS